MPDSGREPYVIALPLPNVTGDLHMGHALNGSYQDTLIRLRRMQGRDTLWICGTDHASIAVHAVIEKQLRAEGLTRWDLGRERFLERVWQWRAETGATIIRQFKRLGCSLDYGHERFTMDEGYVDAVLTMFVELFRKGYIYRDNRMINWCPTCASTISDLEVRYEHAVDTLYEVRYRIAGTDDFLTVATVRPETILADTAVAVHPDDERYRHLVGGTAIVPLVDREVPIIADEYVKMDFGTGALKVTPGHDLNDFEIGRRHGLPELAAIGFDGRMTELAGEFAGLPAAEAREKVRDALFAQGLLRKEQPYEHEVGHCDRSGDRIEPLISLQWFMRDGRAGQARQRGGAIGPRALPSQEPGEHLLRLDAEPAAVVHLAPAVVGASDPGLVLPGRPRRRRRRRSRRPVRHAARASWSATPTCSTRGSRRRSGRSPRWAGRSDDPRLERYYPGHVLATARDIINLWVARMLMMGHRVHGRDPVRGRGHQPRRSWRPTAGGCRSRSETGIDPLELVDSYGADATRYGLLKMSSTQDVRFSAGMIEEGGKFANKLWNAARFVLTQADTTVEPAPAGTTLEDRWIRSRLAGGARRRAAGLIDRYDFSGAVKALYAFVWNDFCDWYVEAVKPRLRGDSRADASANLLWVLERILALTHPVLPVRDRGGVGAHAGRARAAHAGPVPGGRRGRTATAMPSVT